MWILGVRLGKLGIVALRIYLKSWDRMTRRCKTWLRSSPSFMDVEKCEVLGRSYSTGRNTLMTQKPREECFQGICRQEFTEPIAQIFSFWPQCPGFRGKIPSSYQLHLQDNSFLPKDHLHFLWEQAIWFSFVIHSGRSKLSQRQWSHWRTLLGTLPSSPKM